MGSGGERLRRDAYAPILLTTGHARSTDLGRSSLGITWQPDCRNGEERICALHSGWVEATSEILHAGEFYFRNIVNIFEACRRISAEKNTYKNDQMRVAVEAVICELVSAATLAVIREIYREFFKFRPIEKNFTANLQQKSNLCADFP
jgi:hypothetical protein